MPSRWIIAVARQTGLVGLLVVLMGQAMVTTEALSADSASSSPSSAPGKDIDTNAMKSALIRPRVYVPATDCKLPTGPTRRVMEILNARSIRLDDGSVVRLTGIQTPERIISVQSMTSSDRPHQATFLYLRKLILGRAIELRSARRGRDRHNRVRAHVFMLRGDERLWVQGELVRAGLALARTEIGDRNNACVKKLQAFERDARDNARGNWGNRIFRILDASKPVEIANYEQSFQLVEGRVRRVSEFNNKLYLNFGYNWKTDFTLLINRYILRRMKGRLDELKKLKGRTVRVRGWIEMKKGPLISLTAAHDLEILPD